MNVAANLVEPRTSLKEKSAVSVPDIAVFVFLIPIVVFYSFFSPRDLADYDSYLMLTDSIYHFFDPRNIIFEPGSTLLLYLCRVVTSTTEYAVDLAHYVLAVTFLLLSRIMARRSNTSLIGILIFFSFFGPLLAFVTIRATPAYFLITWAAIEASRGRIYSLIIAGAALLFHVSAALALPPLFFALLQNRSSILSWLERSIKGFLYSTVIGGLILYYFFSNISSFIVSLVESVPFLTKYTVYITALTTNDVGRSGQASENSELFHLVFLIGSSALAFLFMMQKDEACVKFRAYLIISYITFLFLQFSPVSAFRQSPFWMIPTILLFPWRAIAFRGFGTGAVALSCVVIFVFQISSVII